MRTTINQDTTSKITTGFAVILAEIGSIFDYGSLFFPTSASRTTQADILRDISKIHQDVVKRTIDLTNDGTARKLT